MEKLKASGDGMERTYSIGRVVSGAFQILRRGFVPLIALILLFGLVPTILSYLFILPAVGGLAATPEAQQAQMNAIRAHAGLLVPAYVVLLLVTCASYMAQFHAAIRIGEGDAPRILDSAAHGIRKALPMLGLTVLTYIALVIASVLFIIPALILLVRWSASAQALAVENVGIIGALRRSGELTRGSRWRILLMVIVGFMLLAVWGLGIFAAAGLVAALGPVGFVAQTLAGFLFGLLIVTLSAAHYLELRALREEMGAGRLAEVFA